MKLSPAQNTWLTHADNLRVMDAIGRDNIRYVGGCVRNALLGQPITDIDMATTIKPDAVITALKAADIQCVPTGLSHGTVTAVINGAPIEITTLRKDVATDGRRATVAFTTDWAQDAARRDFTINALYASVDGEIFDPTEQGLSDIKDGRFRFVGNAADRVAEDYLRILRYFRFLAWYGGASKLDKEALSACREGRSGLKTLSAERVWSEIKKLLSAPNPARITRIMLNNDILETVMPEATNAEGLDAFMRLETREALSPDPLLRLMALAARNPLPMALLCKRMKMSNAEKARLRGWADDATAFNVDMSEREKLAAIYTAGERRSMDRCIIRAAGEDDPLLSARWMSVAELAQSWTPPDFPITGADLIAAGVPKGPAMGKRMEALKALWVRSGFTADKSKLLMALKLMGG